MRDITANLELTDLDGTLPPGAQLFRLLRGYIVKGLHDAKIAGKPGVSTVLAVSLRSWIYVGGRTGLTSSSSQPAF